MMENGGRGEHRPWKIDEEIVPIYRYFATLHHQLVPYLYGLGVEAHQGGEPIIREPDRTMQQYRLGEDLFVAPIMTRDDEREVVLPSGSRWFDYWDDRQPIEGGSRLQYQAEIERMPLFIRSGAIIPMQVSDGETGHGGVVSQGALTLVLYPDGETRRVLRPDSGQEIAVESVRTSDGVSVAIGATTTPVVLRIKESTRPSSVATEAAGTSAPLADVGTFSNLGARPSAWAHDAVRGYVWVRLPATSGQVTVRYSTP
jgi:alpha-glucosidase (family GH31 glycosyl hydrolase)